MIRKAKGEWIWNLQLRDLSCKELLKLYNSELVLRLLIPEILTIPEKWSNNLLVHLKYFPGSLSGNTLSGW
jgi:hypothetical protein